MKTITRFYPILSLLIGSLLAVANPGDADNLDQHQQTLKAVREYHEAEARLEKAYKERLAAAHGDAERKSLIASQKAWIAYRDSVIFLETPDENDWGSGTNERLHILAKRLTEERISVLILEL